MLRETGDTMLYNDTESGKGHTTNPIAKWVELKKINKAMQLVLLAQKKTRGEQPFDDLNNFFHEAEKQIK